MQNFTQIPRYANFKCPKINGIRTLMWKNDKPYAVLGMDKSFNYYFCLLYRKSKKGELWLIAPVESKRFELFLDGKISTRSMICRAQTFRRKETAPMAPYTDSVLVHFISNKSKYRTNIFIFIENVTQKMLPERGEFFTGNRRKFERSLKIMKENEIKIKNEKTFFWEREDNKSS